MANREKGEVGIEVKGKHFTLVMTINAQCEVEDRLSTAQHPVTWRDFMVRLSDNSMRDIRLFFWAATREHHAELTDQQVGKLIDALGTERTAAVMVAIVTGTQPDEADLKAAGLTAADRPQTAQNGAPAPNGGISTSTVGASG